MAWLAKEVCLVGRYHVDQMDQFLLQSLLGKQKVAIPGVGGKGEVFQPPLDSHLKHRFFLSTESDASLVIDELAKTGVVPTRDKFVATVHGVSWDGAAEQFRPSHSFLMPLLRQR